MLCPCGSQRPYATCCGPFLEGQADPPTAVALMRSRYTAYAQGAVEYLLATHHPRPPREQVATWAERAEFLSLQIVATTRGEATDEDGEVEFLARYREDGVERVHHERSHFGRRDGRWVYLDRDQEAGPKNTVPKVGRNDPCPCGSGKKYKKCCGA